MKILDEMLNDESSKNIMKGKIVYRNIDDLIPNKNNFFSMKDIPSLAESIAEGGLLQPILIVDKLDGSYIHSGHRRVGALKLLASQNVEAFYMERKLENEVPCILYKQEDDLQERISIMRSNSYRNFTAEEKVQLVTMAHELWNELPTKPAGREREWITALLGISDGTVKKILTELNSGQLAPEDEMDSTTIDVINGKIKFYRGLSLKLSKEDLNEFMDCANENVALELLGFVTDCKNTLEEIQIEVQQIVKKVSR